MLNQYAHLLIRAWKYRLMRDGAELRWISRTLRPGECCLDIGSHKGAYTYWMARRVGSSGRVVAFEPQPGYAADSKALWAWRGRGQVRVEHLALSNKEGTATLFIPHWGNAPAASLHRSALGEGATSVDVPMMTLDAYAEREKLPRVALIKVDVEGHELSVFEGARALLTRDKPALIFECESRFAGDEGGSGAERVRRVFAFLEGLGYRGACVAPGRSGDGLMPLAEFDPAVHQREGAKPYYNNFVFTA